MQVRLRQFISPLALFYGIYTAFSMQRDFTHTTQLTVFLWALVPVFFLLQVLDRFVEAESRAQSRVLKGIHWFCQSLSQTVSQYILMFCLPFFFISSHPIYGAITTILLATTLWEPWWRALVVRPVYRLVLRLWSVLCASSFLLPFLWPSILSYFNWVLLAASTLALVPSSRQRADLRGAVYLFAASVFLLFALQGPLRFPILSVWLDKPRFATNEDQKEKGVRKLPTSLTLSEWQTLLAEGHSLCCVAPIVAPPGLKERVRQEWSIDGKLLQSALLSRDIIGNREQRGFHSFFCKKNFPALSLNQSIKCQLSVSNRLVLGEIQIQIVETQAPPSM